MAPEDLPEQSDPIAEVYARAVQFFGQHMVCLTGSYIPIDSAGRKIGKEEIFSFSGFVMSFGGDWFLVTAGHVLEDKLDKRIDAKQIKVLQSGIKDDFGPNVTSPYHTPIDYESTERWSINDENLGLDFGVMYLRDLYRRGLEVNKVVPIAEDNWIHQRGEHLDVYFLLGLPEELKSPTRQMQTELSNSLVSDYHPVLLPVERTDQPHRELAPSEFPWFIGKVNTDLVGLQSIKGMSG
jgi:hypothetical protein